MKHSALNMRELIDDILEVARIEAKGLVVERKEESVVSMVEELLGLFGGAAREKNIELRSSLPVKELTVLGERRRILQVLSNLVGNSMKFTSPQGVITIRAEDDGPFVRFSVEDTGKGIPAEMLPHVFDRYWQAPENIHKGTGLGLAIVQSIVQAHGGKVWVESLYGSGCTFHFTLPRAGSQMTGTRIAS